MKVLFCGSRYLDTRQVKVAGRIILRELAELNSATDTIIHGNAMGIDRQVDIIAKEMRFQVSIYEPNYGLYGRSAPLARDIDMVHAAERVIAIWDGESHGTKYTINNAIRTNKPVRLYKFEGQERFTTTEPVKEI